MKAKIERGTALVLVGPQGCGKTLLARELAAELGTFEHVEVYDLEDRNRRKRIFDAQPQTVIIEGLPARHALMEILKAMITTGSYLRVVPKQPAKVVPAPNFVFCTGDEDPLKALDGRRFRVVHMGAGQ